jgi:hypothetical protein
MSLLIPITAWLVVTAWCPQQAAAAPRGVVDPPSDVTAQLRAEAARLENGHASEFFAALIEASRPGNREGFTDELPEMIERDQGDPAVRDALRGPALIRQADRVTRDVLRFWLDRALEPGYSPPTLEEWRDVRARVVGHGEAIVLEAVLSLAQAKHWRERASRPLMPQLAGRYSLIPIDYVDGHELKEYTRGQYFSVIHQQQYRNSATDLFRILIGNRGVSHSTGRPAPRTGSQVPGLTQQQWDVLARLESLARNAGSFWWVRDVEAPPRPRDPDPQGIRNLPPTPAMELRFSDRGRRIRASIDAHAEEMVIAAVLTPKQVEQAKRRLWNRWGLHALLDPELGARLNLSLSQRAELTDRLKERLEIYHWVVRGGDVEIPKRTPRAGVAALKPKRKGRLDHDVPELDDPIWSILSDEQLRTLGQLLGQPEAEVLPPVSRTGAK